MGAIVARSVVVWHEASCIEGNKVHHRYNAASMVKNGTLILEQETRRRAAGDRFEACFSGKAIDDFEG